MIDAERTTIRRPSRWISIPLAALAAAALLASCSSHDVSHGAGPGTVEGTADPGVGTASPSEGAALYAQSCASCHGTDLRGTDKGPSHLSETYAPGHHPDKAIRAAIQNGAPQHHWEFGDMPAVPGLDDRQIDAIIAYMRQQQTERGLEPYPPE